jgi:hypothetical protein
LSSLSNGRPANPRLTPPVRWLSISQGSGAAGFAAAKIHAMHGFSSIECNQQEHDQMPTDWIPFEEGEYWVEQAYIVAPDKAAVALEAPYIEVAQSPLGKRHLVGKGRVLNLLVVELLEDSDDLDVLLDLGGDFKYRLVKPRISAGKVFAPDVKSTLLFAPVEPWMLLSVEAFAQQLAALKRIDKK